MVESRFTELESSNGHQTPTWVATSHRGGSSEMRSPSTRMPIAENVSTVLQLDRQLVDLGRHDKVALGEAADRVGPEFDGHAAVFDQIQVRMVAFRLRELSHAVE